MANTAFEDITSGLRRWQFLLGFLDMFIAMLTCPAHFAMPYFAPKIDYWCAPPPSLRNVSSDAWRNFSSSYSSAVDGLSRCEQFDFDYFNMSSGGFEQLAKSAVNSTNEVKKCESWSFDKSVWQKTITEDWNLVCDRKFLISVSSSMYLIGLMFGVVAFGQISDRIGRKKSFLLGLVIWLIAGLVIVFSNSLAVFSFFRFIIGVVDLGCATSGYIMFQESLSNKNRSIFGNINGFGFSVATISLAGVAYVLKDWRYIEIFTTVPLLLVIIIVLFVPESPRWLISVGKFEEALETMKKIAKFNRQVLPPDDVIMEELREIEFKMKSKSQNQANISDLFKTKNMRRKTIILYYIWFVVALTYFALSLNIQDLGGDLFLSMAIAGCLDVVGYFLTVLVMSKIGRRIPTAASLIVGGVSLVISMLLPKSFGWLKIGIALIGRTGISMTFSLIYVFTPEVHPTVVRNVGIGSSSTIGRIGSIMAPYATNLDDISSPYISKTILAVLAITAGISTLGLPETRNRNLPETLEDGENYELDSEDGKSNFFSNWSISSPFRCCEAKPGKE